MKIRGIIESVDVKEGHMKSPHDYTISVKLRDNQVNTKLGYILQPQKGIDYKEAVVKFKKLKGREVVVNIREKVGCD